MTYRNKSGIQWLRSVAGIQLQLFGLILALSTAAIFTGCSAVATGGAEATGLALLHDRRDSATLLDDEGIEISADIKINTSSQLRKKSHINVTSYNGKVLITGEAANADVRHKITALVRIIPGVKQVHNEITVGQNSSISSRTQDSYITTKVKTALSEIQKIPGFDATRVKVVTERQIVYLMGLVYSKEGKLATQKAQQVEGVKQIVTVFEYLD